MTAADEARTEAARRYPPNHTVEDPFGATGEAQSDPYGYEQYAHDSFIAGAEWQASRKPEAAPSDTDREALARAVFIASDDFAFADRMAKAWDAPGPHGRARWYRYADAVLAAGFSRSQPVQVEVTDALERAMFDVESKHHFHNVTCLCGFSSRRSRSRTEHITAEVRAALGGAQ